MRYEDPNGLKLKPFGSNFSEIVLNLNNTDGSIPLTSKGEKGVFSMPMPLLWTKGLNLLSLFNMGANPYAVATAYCEQLLSNEALKDRLRREKFDVAIVDLIYNECGLALANHLGLPSVAYWAFSFAGGEAELTTAALPASHVPTFLSMLTHEMNFFERALVGSLL